MGNEVEEVPLAQRLSREVKYLTDKCATLEKKLEVSTEKLRDYESEYALKHIKLKESESIIQKLETRERKLDERAKTPRR